jgi:small-conductance mechanosensitive channel
MEVLLAIIGEKQIVFKLIGSGVGLLVTMFIIRLITKILYSTIENNKKYYIARKRVYYLFSSIFVIFIIFLWSDTSTSLTTYFGLVSAGVAISLKDLFTNIAAWVFIILRKPFKVSDRIIINEQRGDVIDIRMLQFSLIEISAFENGGQSTGRIVTVPNYYVFVYPIVNYTKGFQYIWNEIKVLITFESDWQKAKSILMNICTIHSTHSSNEATQMMREAKKEYMINYKNLTPIVYTDVKDSGVLLTMRYLCNPRQRRNSVNDIWEDILIQFKKSENINLAYPTMRVTKE